MDNNGTLRISVFDGTRNLIPNGKQLLFRIVDGRQKEIVTKNQASPNMTVSLSIANNFEDDYTVIVSGNGYRQAGFRPIAPESNKELALDLMLLPKETKFEFNSAKWETLLHTHPKWTSFLKGQLDETTAENQYVTWMKSGPEQLAAFLNFAEALGDVRFRTGVAFDYLRQPLTGGLAKDCLVDRCFAFSKIDIVTQLKCAVEDGTFEYAYSDLHPGATRSFKEIRFGEANLQITLHENDRCTIGEDKHIKVEIDMDYHKDPLAHFLFEVLPNSFGGTTDPRRIYCLRWIAGRRSGVGEFDPPYKLV